MAEILSDALKEDQCEGLLRLIAGLIYGAGRPKPARILRLADVKRKLLQSGALIETLLGAITNSKAGHIIVHDARLAAYSFELRFLSPTCST